MTLALDPAGADPLSYSLS